MKDSSGSKMPGWASNQLARAYALVYAESERHDKDGYLREVLTELMSEIEQADCKLEVGE